MGYGCCVAKAKGEPATDSSCESTWGPQKAFDEGGGTSTPRTSSSLLLSSSSSCISNSSSSLGESKDGSESLLQEDIGMWGVVVV